jgi:hypothetical protein
MKHLKLFESYSKPQFRIPEEVSEREFEEKKFQFGQEPHGRHVQFTSNEKDLLNGLTINSIIIRGGWSKWLFSPNHFKNLKVFDGDYFFTISIYNSDARDFCLCKIKITKLEDNWYLIDYYLYLDGNKKYYICDDWEEVLGYLSSQGFNI